MTLRLLALALLVSGGPAWAQSQPAPAPAPDAPQAPQTAAPASPADALPDAPSTTSDVKPPVTPTGPTAVIDTTMGRLTCKLYDKQAPVTVANFIGLAEGTKDWTDPKTLKKVHGESFYNGTTFHRVIPGFMIQGGDRLGDGRGDPGYLFQDEFDPTLTFDEPGRLAMANSGPNTNGSQFFITEVPVPQLNGKHTIFGQCDAHTALLVGSIARVQRDENDKPITPVVINKITIVRDGQPMPPEPPQPAAAPGTAAAPPAAN
ncbi:MAG TPA: peptidylprolyl isomerase [Edaphobacter sp.]|nr:peptidylprolyl isomerase [Edaphobacter sp.]